MSKVSCKYLIGNAKNIKEIFNKQKIDKPQLIISSPPYFDVLNYNNHKEQIGFGQKYDDYLDDVVNVFQDCYDLSKDSATFWLIVDTFKKNGEVKLLPFDIANRLREKSKNTWKLKEVIIWDKEKNLPWNGKGNFKNRFEYLLFFSKRNNFKFNIDSVREINDLKKWWKTYPERYNPDGKAPSNLWEFTTPLRGWGDGKQNHLCPFPFPLVEKIISIASDKNDLICDPFAGSGSVLSIAQCMGRRSIGIDVNKKYKELFEKEVMIGGKNYWEDRKGDIEKHKDLITNFKGTNKKLRKLKIANNICNHINNINKGQFIYITKDSKPSTNKIEIYVAQNGRVPKINLENEEVIKLMKQAKIEVDIQVLKDIELFKIFKHVKLFKYKFNKFYSYTSSCKSENIPQIEEKYNFIYSNIEIKIFEK